MKTHTDIRQVAIIFRVIRLSLVAIACGILSACSLFESKRIFDDAYYDNNFIADIGFSRFVGSDTLVTTAADTTGVWDFEYRNSAWDGYGYMTLAATGNVAGFYDSASGLDSSATVYRLELVNLVSGGDFESSAGTWSTTGTSTSSYPAGTAINGNSVYQYLEAGSTHSLVYTLSPVSGQLVTGNSYFLYFKWSPSTGTSGPNMTDSTAVSTVNSSNPNFSYAVLQTSPKYIGLGQCGFQAAATNQMTFKAPATWLGTIDDVQVRKPGNMKLRLLLKKTDTEPDLEDFLYIFSVWVHADPAVVSTTTSPYPLDSMKIDMQDTGSSSLSKSVDSNYSYSTTPGGWQKMAVRVDNGNLQIDSGATGAVLELIIDLDSSLTGTVLLAQPELRAYPDGY